MSPGRDGSEGHSERINRELLELLNELRVALPGVQVLFAFLLAVPFSQGFANVTSFQRAPAEGRWHDGGLAEHEDIAVIEVMRLSSIGAGGRHLRPSSSISSGTFSGSGAIADRMSAGGPPRKTVTGSAW